MPVNFFKSWGGLTKLSGDAKGNELFGVGIRPYGLHAGNLASMVVYPYLFFENFEARRTKGSAHFTFQVWLNDIEPVSYVGADGEPGSADWANMYPGSTSFQMTPAPGGFKGNLADYWQPAIEGIVRGTIGPKFPNVVLEFRRASELSATPEFEKVVIGCISKAEDVKHYIDRWNINVAHVQGPASFVWPLCPECNDPLINPELALAYDTGLISAWHDGTWSDAISEKQVSELNWAVQFRMLHAARLAAIQPDIWFMGMDHVTTNMGCLMEDLADLFEIDRHRGVFLHAPLLFANGEKKLSKSAGNAAHIPIKDLIGALRGNHNFGLDVEHALVSPDILSIGQNLLPRHIAGDDQRRRRTALRKEADDYEKSDWPEAFKYVNRKGKISNYTVAGMLGVPHIN